MSGIVSYGAYIPRYKIETTEIAAVWGQDGSAMARNLNVFSKSVPGPDEDVITIAVESARTAMKRCGVTGQQIGAIYTGSESWTNAKWQFSDIGLRRKKRGEIGSGSTGSRVSDLFISPYCSVRISRMLAFICKQGPASFSGSSNDKAELNA